MTTKPKASQGKKAAQKKSASHLEEKLQKVVGVRELRQQASRVLDLVKKGEVIVVTEHGKPIAEIVPIKKTKLERLIEHGAVTPAKEPFDLDFWNNTDGPRYPEGLELFLKERREARY
jgi:prevent-host-death family protein